MNVHNTTIEDLAEQYAHGYRERDVLIVLYYAQRKSMSQIADGFDVSTQTVLKWMKRHNLPRRQRGGHGD